MCTCIDVHLLTYRNTQMYMHQNMAKTHACIYAPIFWSTHTRKAACVRKDSCLNIRTHCMMHSNTCVRKHTRSHIHTHCMMHSKACDRRHARPHIRTHCMLHSHAKLLVMYPNPRSPPAKENLARSNYRGDNSNVSYYGRRVEHVTFLSYMRVMDCFLCMQGVQIYVCMLAKPELMAHKCAQGVENFLARGRWWHCYA